MTHVKFCRTIDSPIGPLLLAGRDGALTNLAMDGQTHPPAGADDWLVDNRAFADVVEQLRAYFARRLSSFEVALDAEGTDFQRQVWDALLAIPFGQTRSYGEIARAVGRPNASRAVGMANGRNPIAILVPCHRVIGADGRLTGFGGGLHRKQALLDLEQAALREAAEER
ncbi:MAG TPA: methylated-DNA--[protein]-cysteine S-methyltransferase [Acidimicrobiales bacterium]|nr:methylated-DNA--[protein]-cysteine S-methyltransferase [Acidimicrobiales bacterium]